MEHSKNFMDVDLYYRASGFDNPEAEKRTGGQQLILPDIVACFAGCETIFLPLHCPVLATALKARGFVLTEGMYGAQGVYWGTPTIVNNERLFPPIKNESYGPAYRSYWDLRTERQFSVKMSEMAVHNRLKKIVTALGTGDISAEERLIHMGGGAVVSHKNFGHFEDWVLMRNIEAEELGE